ncbi:Phosphopantetheine adenylyltransferase [Desulforamulus reducens MI-1]|uniref:Phosphopantetheine adenylyltransferase n=1 Tax=Desulforamulus reducens (strain ATCC BAA-1160 / DSM 100696 / MI-1) TaxID=349161 RepID=COAD_DESRM|nr:pantetheine-phosphate adenylyltransferase [Desulforamulus reducens]A4J698.1 RecName: Full=Phosphopantetheine adenylyltransferase; AltName: Full=Dephospho-CoA pyrophosphorylase; AltName: Full=Pantetheine-phosphate adenylyltransferase; Short=PPAT [Desulforamulus reducens MI-1]ABO50601.1 Phosphopantetheine adenylyltransferase [Desulforamulus reducens MI-1]
MRIGVYPGSFDPVTNGHMDIVERSVGLFDRLIVAVAKNAQKKPLFSVEERVEILKNVLKKYPNIVVDTFDGLTVTYALQQGAIAIVRGLRAFSDFENEFIFALTNKKLAPDLETVYLMTRAEYSFISSTTVKEVASFKGSLSGMVPEIVAQKIQDKYGYGK